MPGKGSRFGKDHDLKQVKIKEMSFVPAGMNGKEYLLLKGFDMKKKDILKKLLEVEDEEFATLLEKEGVEGDAADILRSVGNLLKAYRDELPDDALGLLAKACGYEDPDEGNEVNDGSEADPKVKKGAASGQGSQAGLSKELLEKMDPEVRGLIQTLAKQANSADERATRAETLAKSLQESNLEKEYFEKAEALKHIPGMEPRKFGKTLMVLAKENPIESAQVLTVLRAANALIAKGVSLEEAGVSGNSPLGSVEAKINKMAKGLIRKSGEPMTEEEAICKILEDQPELYAEYEAERQAKVARVSRTAGVD